MRLIICVLACSAHKGNSYVVQSPTEDELLDISVPSLSAQIDDHWKALSKLLLAFNPAAAPFAALPLSPSGFDSCIPRIRNPPGASISNDHVQIQRVSLDALLEEPLSARWALLQSGPLVITDLQDSMLEEGGDALPTLIANHGDTGVEYEIHELASGMVDTYAATLHEALSEMCDSSHAESKFMMAEGLVPWDLELSCRAAVETVLCKEDEGDLFELMPQGVKPSCCLLAGGDGARSNLHADPFEWVGWNVLLQGEKLWTFYPPEATESHLQMFREAPSAWAGSDENGEGGIAAGWQSPLDLFFTRSIDLGDKVCSSRQFKPSTPLSPAAGLPAEVVQRAGEIVLIPPKWTHQTYHCSPTLAVAGQLLATEGFERTAQHCLTWCGAAANEAERHAKMLAALVDPHEKVEQLLRACGIVVVEDETQKFDKA